MSALIILIVLGIWSALVYNAGYYAGFGIERKWIRRVVGVTVVVAVTTLMLWDEILGVREFDALCASARAFQISSEDEGKNFEVQFSRSSKKILPGFLRPVEGHIDTYTELTTGKVIAIGNGYAAKGGFLVRALGSNPLNGSTDALLGNTYCYPSKYKDQVERLRAMINIDV